MSHFDQQRIEFDFEGQFLGFAGEQGKFKYLRLAIEAGEMEIKVPKELRAWVSSSCYPGTSIHVSGIGKLNRHTHELKLKASHITTPLTEVESLNVVPGDAPAVITPISRLPSSTPANSKKSKIKILVCQKSGCLKKGGKGLCESLETTLRDRNLHHHVTIQKTGCLKRCSDAPNLVVMPGNHKFKKIRPELLTSVYQTITRILEKQLSAL